MAKIDIVKNSKVSSPSNIVENKKKLGGMEVSYFVEDYDLVYHVGFKKKPNYKPDDVIRILMGAVSKFIKLGSSIQVYIFTPTELAPVYTIKIKEIVRRPKGETYLIPIAEALLNTNVWTI